MPAGQKRENTKVETQRADDAVETLLRGRVLQALGEPNIRYSVRVRKLWKDHYRVNVVVGEDPSAAKIAHSYFLITDEAGNIIETSPRLAKKY